MSNLHCIKEIFRTVDLYARNRWLRKARFVSPFTAESKERGAQARVESPLTVHLPAPSHSNKAQVEHAPKRRSDEGGLQRFFRSIVGFDNTGPMPDAGVTAGTTVWAGFIGGL